MTRRFTPDDATVGADDDTGDVVIWAGDAAASFVHDAWHPGITFDRHALVSKDSRFSSVRDPAEVQCYLDAAHDALLKSLDGKGDHD